MSEKILSILKPIKFIGNILGFIPFCLNTSHKKFKIFYILNCFYASLLILLMIHNLHHNTTIAIKFFEGGSFLPDLVHQFMQASPLAMSIVITSGTFGHTKSFSHLLQHFIEIDNEARIRKLDLLFVNFLKFFTGFLNKS